MLSDRERRQLADIERELVADDRRLAASLRAGRTRPGRAPRRWLERALIGFGVLLLVVALLTSVASLFLQGLLFAGAGVLRWRWRLLRAAVDPPGGGPGGGDAAPSPRPDGSPPGWFRSV
jgi:hypothetical protein